MPVAAEHTLPRACWAARPRIYNPLHQPASCNRVQRVLVDYQPERRLVRWNIVWSTEHWADNCSFAVVGNIFDNVHDATRKMTYGRCHDIEEISYVLSPKGVPTHVAFNGTFAHTKQWGSLARTHYSHVIPFSELHFAAGRPCIYVSTWNHMLHIRDTNKVCNNPLFTQIVEDGLFQTGGRDALEKQISLPLPWKKNIAYTEGGVDLMGAPPAVLKKHTRMRDWVRHTSALLFLYYLLFLCMRRLATVVGRMVCIVT